MSPEIKSCIDGLFAGAPLGEIISRLEEINNQAIVESYRSGLSLRQCGRLHGVPWHCVRRILEQVAPDIEIRRRGWPEGRQREIAAKDEARP